METRLHAAVKKGRANAVSKLLAEGAEINAEDDWGATPLHLAVSEKKSVKLLIEAGANVNATDCHKETPLHFAVNANNEKIASLLIEAGANLNEPDYDSNTPLYTAVLLRNLRMCKLLVDAGADVFVRCEGYESEDEDNEYLNSMKSPILKAVESRNRDILKFFIDSGTDVNCEDDDGSWLHLAAKKSRTDASTFKILVDAGADLNKIDDYGHSPLNVAIYSKNFNIAKLLVDAGANLNEDTAGNIPLRTAIWESNTRIFKLLLDAGADISVKKEKSTLLHLAVKNKNAEICELLLDKGADVNAKDGNELTPLCIAASRGEAEIIEYLVEAGANVNILTGSGTETPFSLIVRRGDFSWGHLDCLKLMIECTDVNLKNETGVNILSDIFTSERESIKKLSYTMILEHVAKLRALDLQVDPSLMDIISGTNEYQKYFKKCMQELEKAKSSKLHKSWVTFLNLLVDDEHKFVKYAGNKYLTQDFKKKVNKFPIYKDKMQSNVSKGIEERKLYDAAANALSYFLPIFKPSHLIITNILDNLVAKNWKKMCC